MKKEENEILDFVADTIKPFYFIQARSWVLNNCDITDRESVPKLFGDTPIQYAFTNFVMLAIGQ